MEVLVTCTVFAVWEPALLGYTRVQDMNSKDFCQTNLVLGVGLVQELLSDCN